MGQTNQSQNQYRDSNSSCCLSRRYTIHTNMQKQNKFKSNNPNTTPFQNHELHIYSKQRHTSNYHPKPHSNPLIPSTTQFNLHQENPQQQKIKCEQIGNLGLESHLVEKIENNHKNVDLTNQKKQILQLPDVSQENERNSTRENSLSSRNLSNKNSISTNHHKLRNKIKNLKFKYTTTPQQQTDKPPTKQPLTLQTMPEIASKKNNNFTNNHQDKMFTLQTSLNKEAPLNWENSRNQLSGVNKAQLSEQIEFFSQNSDSNSFSSSKSQKAYQNYDANEQMLSSKKIDLMVRQFNKDIKNSNKTNELPQLERIPEESQRIQSSKSQDELSHANKNKYHKSPLPHKISQETFDYQDHNLDQEIQIQKCKDLTQERAKREHQQKVQIGQKINEGTFCISSTRFPDGIRQKIGKVQGGQRIVVEKISKESSKNSSKRIIAF